MVNYMNKNYRQDPPPPPPDDDPPADSTGDG
jgi:hypothetical protein